MCNYAGCNPITRLDSRLVVPFNVKRIPFGPVLVLGSDVALDFGDYACDTCGRFRRAVIDSISQAGHSPVWRRAVSLPTPNALSPTQQFDEYRT